MDILLAAATLIGGAAGFWYFRDKIANWFGGGPAVSKHDLELYEKYKNLFVTKGVADFYSQHDFLGSFQEDYWIPLSNYVDTWHSVEYEFVDKRLNSAHKKVYSSASKLGVAIAKNTVPIGTKGVIRSVKADHLPVGPTPESILEEAKEINNLVPDFIRAHKRFVRLANSRLTRISTQHEHSG